MNQSGRAGDEAKKRKSPAKSGRVGITATGYILQILDPLRMAPLTFKTKLRTTKSHIIFKVIKNHNI